jgi:hypothetical protein
MEYTFGISQGVFSTVLAVHICFGFIALLDGIIPMFAKKGGKLHNTTGLIYFWAMLLIFVTGVPLAVFTGNIFLFTIAIFSFYMAFTGYRWAKLKPGVKPAVLDHVVSWVAFACGVSMLGFSTYILVFISVQTVAIILLIFGGICFAMSFTDLRRLLNKKKAGPTDWFFGHLGRMIGSYIATFTAFSATNMLFMPTLVTWLLPSVIGTVAIVLISRHFRKKFKA